MPRAGRRSGLKTPPRFARTSNRSSRLTKLEFPRTEIQVYGRAVIIYTSYLFEAESSGGTQRESGKAVEVFVMRNGKWVNSGWQLAPDRAQP